MSFGYLAKCDEQVLQNIVCNNCRSCTLAELKRPNKQIYSNEMFKTTDTVASSKLEKIFVASLNSRLRASFLGLYQNEY